MIQKTFMVLMMILILVATVLIFLYNFIFLIFTVKKESTIVVDGTTYIKREVSAAEDPSRIQYHEVVTPFFYKEGPTDSIINQEKHTGIILSAHRRGGDSGSVYILEVDIGSDNPLEFTMPDNPTFPLTEPVPTGITVQIECDLHPKSDYHIIRKMTPIRL